MVRHPELMVLRYRPRVYEVVVLVILVHEDGIEIAGHEMALPMYRETRTLSARGWTSKSAAC